MTNSKNKGNNFERKIAKQLSQRFAEKTGIESAFRRSTDSGSYFGGTNQKRKETHDIDFATFGDIICPKAFEFSIECKHYKKPPLFSNFIDEKCTMIDEWIVQAEQDSINSNKKMAIIMKFNNVKETVVLKELFGNLKSLINYKEYFIVSLEDFLGQDDSHFFDKKTA